MSEENKEEDKKDKKSFVPVIILAVIVFGIVIALNYTSKHDVKIGENNKEEDKGEAELKIDVNNDKEWANTMGYLIGKQMVPTLKDGLLVDDENKYRKDVLNGIREAFAEKEEGEKKFTEEEIILILKEREKVAKERIKKIAEDNKKLGDEYVANYEKEEGVEKIEDRALYKKIAEGDGDVVGKDIANVKYIGKHIDGKEFDNSTKHGEDSVPFTSATILPALGEVLELMKKGDKWEIVLPVESAYGEQIPPGAPIEPNEALIFEIEIISIEKAPEAQEVGSAPQFETVESVEATQKVQTEEVK